MRIATRIGLRVPAPQPLTPLRPTLVVRLGQVSRWGSIARTGWSVRVRKVRAAPDVSMCCHVVLAPGTFPAPPPLGVRAGQRASRHRHTSRGSAIQEPDKIGLGGLRRRSSGRSVGGAFCSPECSETRLVGLQPTGTPHVNRYWCSGRTVSVRVWRCGPHGWPEICAPNPHSLIWPRTIWSRIVSVIVSFTERYSIPSSWGTRDVS